MNLGLLVALENADKVLPNIQRIFNTGPYGDPPLKIKKILVLHKEKIEKEKCTLTSVKRKISKIGLRHVLSWPKLDLQPELPEAGTFDS